MPTEMNEFMKRATCHEAGHIVVALKLGIPVEAVRVGHRLILMHVSENDFDSTARPAIDRYAFLAGGIAAEQFIFGDYDRSAMRDDQTKVTQRNGVAVETYLPEALAIVSANKYCLDHVRRQLHLNWIAARAEAQFCSDSDSYTILSRSDLDDILRAC